MTMLGDAILWSAKDTFSFRELNAILEAKKNKNMPYPSRSISGRGWPDSVLAPPIKPLSGIRPPFNQYETGAGDASTWHSSATSDPNGAPNNCDGALTVGETIKKELERFFYE